MQDSQTDVHKFKPAFCLLKWSNEVYQSPVGSKFFNKEKNEARWGNRLLTKNKWKLEIYTQKHRGQSGEGERSGNKNQLKLIKTNDTTQDTKGTKTQTECKGTRYTPEQRKP